MEYSTLVLLYPIYVAAYIIISRYGRRRGTDGSYGATPGPLGHDPTQSTLPSPISMPTRTPSTSPASLSILPPMKPSRGASSQTWLSVLVTLYAHMLLLISSLPRAGRTLIWVTRTALAYKW